MTMPRMRSTLSAPSGCQRCPERSARWLITERDRVSARRELIGGILDHAAAAAAAHDEDADGLGLRERERLGGRRVRERVHDRVVAENRLGSAGGEERGPCERGEEKEREEAFHQGIGSSDLGSAAASRPGTSEV